MQSFDTERHGCNGTPLDTHATLLPKLLCSGRLQVLNCPSRAQPACEAQTQVGVAARAANTLSSARSARRWPCKKTMDAGRRL